MRGQRGKFRRHIFPVNETSTDALQNRLAFIGIAQAAATHAALVVRQRKGVDAAPGTDADAAVFHKREKFFLCLCLSDSAVYGAADFLLRANVPQKPRGKPVRKHIGICHIQFFLLPCPLMVFPIRNARVCGQGQVERIQMLALADVIERAEHKSNQFHRWIMLVPSLRIDRALHEIIPRHGGLAQAVQDDMAMQVAGVVVSVRVCDGQRLMPREKAVGKLHANRLRLIRRQAVIRHVARVEADDVVMRLDLLETAVLSPLAV